MTTQTALQPIDLEPGRARLAVLELELARRQHDVIALTRALQQLQSRYLTEIGALYGQLSTLEAAVAEAEIAQGLRPAPLPDDDDFEPDPASRADDQDGGTCANRAAPSGDLKKAFRDLAKAIHPDLALDEPARCRRHSLMAEANRAYAERDEDRLRLILRKWERSPEAVVGEDPEADRARADRRIAELDEQILALDRELADLRASAINRLNRKMDEARAQGWDLFAEIVLQVKREIARANARLASLRLARTNTYR